jgi:hypothetical protein
MELNEAKINLGRVLAALGREDELKTKNALVQGHTIDRMAFAKGLLKGLLEKGDWETAVNTLYKPGPMYDLFDGDWSGFEQDVLDSVKRVGLTSNIDAERHSIRNLRDRGMTTLLYKMATEVPCVGDPSYDPRESILKEISDAISDDDKKQAYNTWGAEAREQGRWQKAWEYFSSAENEAAIDELCDELIPQAEKHLLTLMYMVKGGHLGRKIKKRYHRMIFDQVMKQDKLEEVIRFNNQAEWMYLFSKSVELTPEKQDELTEIAAARMGHSDVLKMKDDKLSLAWAKKNAEKHPNDAYRIFVKQGYEGVETFWAARRIYTHSPSKVQKRDLRAICASFASVYDKMQFAREVNDDDIYIAVSKECEAQGELTRAYDFWISGNGDLTDPFINDVRERIVQGVVQENERSQFSMHGLTGWLNDEDEAGHTQLYHMLFERFPADAYHLARNLGDKKLVRDARQMMVTLSPERALSSFINFDDKKGFKLAEAAVLEKYSITQEALREYITPVE